MAELDDIYSTRLLELASDIPHSGRLEKPDATALAHSKLCGSTITVDLGLEKGRITRFAQDVKACLLGQASAAIVGREIIGTTIEEFHAVAAATRAMIKDGGPAPAGRWADLGLLAPVKDYKHRQTSTLLIFEAIERALGEAERAGAPAHATVHRKGAHARH